MLTKNTTHQYTPSADNFSPEMSPEMPTEFRMGDDSPSSTELSQDDRDNDQGDDHDDDLDEVLGDDLDDTVADDLDDNVGDDLSDDLADDLEDDNENMDITLTNFSEISFNNVESDQESVNASVNESEFGSGLDSFFFYNPIFSQFISDRLFDSKINFDPKKKLSLVKSTRK